jgi:hypothetical protein
MARLITFWISDVQKLQSKLYSMVDTIDSLAINPLLKQSVLADIHTMLRTLGKGKPKKEDHVEGQTA